MRARVLLVDDHQIIREGLRALLRDEADLEVVGEAERADQVVPQVAALRADVVVLDLSLAGAGAGLGGVDVIRQLAAAHPATQVIVLSMHDDPAIVDSALAAGARGYVVKGRGITSLCDAIRAVSRGARYLSPELAERLAAPRDPLTAREREILALVAEGHRTADIAARLGLKPKTVENHRARIMDKLDIRSTAGLVRYALHHGLAR